MSIDNGISPSRLSLNNENLRNSIYTRNLYTLNNQYPLNESDMGNVIKSINSIVGGLMPFKSIALDNSVVGRLLDLPNQSPLSQISLVMLTKQLGYNAISHIAQKNFPVFNADNLFDGDSSTKLFTFKQDMKITKNEHNSGFNNFLDRVIYLNQNNPFTEKSNDGRYKNAEKLRNTGKGQLNFLYLNLNKNVYKSDDITLIETGLKIKNPIQPRNTLVNNGNRIYFSFDSQISNPYYKNRPDTLSIIDADNAMIKSINDAGNSFQEYAPTYEYIEANLGKTNKSGVKNIESLSNKNTPNSWIGGESEFSNDQDSNKLVWGRDGVSKTTKDALSELQGISTEKIDSSTTQNHSMSEFNVKTGLLEYTRNLINATEGRIGDITRKAFANGNDIVGFNGSGLWEAPDTALIAFAGRKGIRQHSVLDKYDKFAKAIRFDGNKVYSNTGGNVDSVIYNSVMPKIHPTPKVGGGIDSKNMMLSLENLAIRVISKDSVGIIDDEYGTQIPLSEVGPFNGRIMWFPPYGLEIQETANAKYESTVMIGRNEPMYNYQNSERMAVLNFIMLIDHPPQVDGFRDSATHHKDLAEFFAFGGGAEAVKTNISNIEAKIDDLERQKGDLIGKTNTHLSNINSMPEYYVYFPNDEPKEGNVNTIFDDIYNKGYGVDSNVISTIDNSHDDLNSKIFFRNGLESYDVSGVTYFKVVNPTVSQYDVITEIDEQGKQNSFVIDLKKMFQNEEDRKFYTIVIEGSTSALHTNDYNMKLGFRRAEATKRFIDSKLQALFGKTAEQLGIEYVITSKGEAGANPLGNNKDNLYSPVVKQDRYSKISIKPNSKSRIEPNVNITAEDKAELDAINSQINSLTKKLNDSKKISLTDNSLSSTGVMNERTVKSNAIGSGFQSIKDNVYNPVFHSQTPEDFHKRLTFLQQCTRQGTAMTYEAKTKDDGTERTRNSVFGRQPICILRVGDFFYTKVVIETVNFDYTETTWDMNPEGFGMQPMIVKVTIQMKVIGGQSLKGPIDALQNAVSFNYYANSTFTNTGMYKTPSEVADRQVGYMKGVNKDRVAGATGYFNSKLVNEDKYKRNTVWGYTEDNKIG